MNLTTSNFINNYGSEKIDSPINRGHVFLRLNSCDPNEGQEELKNDLMGDLNDRDEDGEEDITMVIASQPS